ncbi:22643_t:CDS:2 [Entrophospora sp. SA101]|nr:22643_t:CDS:2 [Entrophospora sp. SA101]
MSVPQEISRPWSSNSFEKLMSTETTLTYRYLRIVISEFHILTSIISTCLN